MVDPYSTLGVEADADDETIRRRYLELVQQCRQCIELFFPVEYRGHPIVHHAADQQMLEPGIVSYQWRVAQQALGVRA